MDDDMNILLAKTIILAGAPDYSDFSSIGLVDLTSDGNSYFSIKELSDDMVMS